MPGKPTTLIHMQCPSLLPGDVPLIRHGQFSGARRLSREREGVRRWRQANRELKIILHCMTSASKRQNKNQRAFVKVLAWCLRILGEL